MAAAGHLAHFPRPFADTYFGRLLALLRDRGDEGRAKRLAILAFAARVLNAGLGFATQVLLARWMGEREYGIYAYLWVWLLVGGGIFSLGLPVAALKFVPHYRASGDLPGLRGFLGTSRTLGLAPALVGALMGGLVVWLSGGSGASSYHGAALVALAVLPIYVLTDIQTGIARAYDHADLGLAADYVLRPLLLLLFAGIVFAFRGEGTAGNIMAATLAATALTALVQGVALNGRLRLSVPSGPQRLDLARWAEVSWPLLTVTGFTLLLGSTDILVLKLFVGPEEIALYFAGTKIVAVASFVSYGVANTSAHRFAAHMATDDRAALAALAADTVRWTFWPTLAVAAVLALLGAPLLALFGPNFQSGHAVVAILGLGLVAGATVGPADRALAMADEGRLAAMIYGASFAANLLLALALIPAFGLPGAAAATALATAGRAAMLFVAARRRLGLDMIVFAPVGRTRPAPAGSAGDDGEHVVELLDGHAAAAIADQWRELAERSLEPNLFYGPSHTLAATRHLPGDARARVLAAWRRDGDGARLVGVLPLGVPRGRYLNPLPVLRAPDFYGTLSTPLVTADRADETLAAMLAELRRRGVRGVVLPFLHARGPVATALGDVAERAGLRTAVLGAHLRAILRSELPGAEYIRATLEPKRRKEADRQRRRLAEEGALTFAVARSEEEVSAVLDDFLALEAAGWKGEAGTDLRHVSGGEPFIREAARELARIGRFRIATLSLDGRTIAAGLVATAGRRAYYLKTAYNESFARFSPGFLLTLDLTSHLLDDSEIDDTDSIAVADHPMVDRIWTERFPVASVVISTGANGGTLFSAAVAVERLRERAVERIKAARAALARSRQGTAKEPNKKS